LVERQTIAATVLPPMPSATLVTDGTTTGTASCRPEGMATWLCDPEQPGQVDFVTVSLIMNVRPLHDRIVVRRLDDGEQNVGGIIIPDSAKEKPQRGTVLAVGSGTVRDDGNRIPLDVKAGDLILFGKYTSQEIKLDGEDYLIMREDEVLAVLDRSDDKRK
jgi:chaperonin GroES